MAQNCCKKKVSRKNKREFHFLPFHTIEGSIFIAVKTNSVGSYLHFSANLGTFCRFEGLKIYHSKRTGENNE